MGRAAIYSGGPARDGEHDYARQELIYEACRQWCRDNGHHVVHVLYAAGTEDTVIEDRWAFAHDVVAGGADLVVTWDRSTWDMGWTLPDVGTYSKIVNAGISFVEVARHT